MKSRQLLIAPLGAVLLFGNSSAFAQPVPPAAQKPAMASLDKANWRAIRVQNARPSMLASMLDPAHNSLPASFNIPGSVASEFRTADEELKKVSKGPFEGLHLVGADTQKLLFVSGKDEAQIAELQAMVALMDKAERHVEVEAQLVELPSAQLKQFGIEFDAATPDAPKTQTPIKGAFQVGFLRNNFQQRLDEMVAAGTANVISTQPQNIINNNSLAISLRTGPIDNTGANQYKMPAAPAEGTDTIITLTPTINGDDTITVSMNLQTLPKNVNSSGLMTIANVGDGDTIALSGLKSSAFPRATNAPTVPMVGDIPLMGDKTNYKVPLIGDIPLISGLFRSKKPGDERATLVFVTARIVRNNEN